LKTCIPTIGAAATPEAEIEWNPVVTLIVLQLGVCANICADKSRHVRKTEIDFIKLFMVGNIKCKYQKGMESQAQTKSCDIGKLSLGE